MPAQNTARPQPIARPDTQQGIQPAYQAKPARRTHRRLLTLRWLRRTVSTQFS